MKIQIEVAIYTVYHSTKVAIFISFELRTPSTPSIGLHPSMLALCYWHRFFSYNFVLAV